jgi:CheY-specific phosphatase CheX
MGELLNMLAGTLKTQLREHGLTVRLGLPKFCRGPVEVSKGSQHRFFDVRIGNVDAACVVHQSDTREAAA